MNFRAALLGLTFGCFSQLVSATIIDFEGYVAGTIIDDEYESTLGVRINGFNIDRSATNLGVVFDTDNFTGEDSDLAAPFFSNRGLGNLNPGNILVIHEHPQQCNAFSCIDPDDEASRPAGYFDIDFTGLVTLNSIDFFDVESAENGNTQSNRIELFDQNDIEILANTFYSPSTGGDNMWDRLAFDVGGISRMRIFLGGSGGIDNIDFTPVPESFAWLLFGLGLVSVRLLRLKK